MDKNIMRNKVKDYVKNLSAEELKKYFALAKMPEWRTVVEKGENVTLQELIGLKVVFIQNRVPGFVISGEDNELVLLFVAEVMERFLSRN